MQLLLTVLGLIVSFAAAACSDDQGQAQNGAGGPPAFPPMEVKTITLEARPLPQSSECVSTVRSLRSITVQPQVEGIVRQIFVMAGDRVGLGQPLIQIDPDKQQATVTTAESQRLSRKPTSRKPDSSHGCRSCSTLARSAAPSSNRRRRRSRTLVPALCGAVPNQGKPGGTSVLPRHCTQRRWWVISRFVKAIG